MSGTKQPSLWKGLLLTVLVFALLLSVLVIGTSSVNNRNESQQMAELEASVRRAAVLCYAVEGRYPESAEELRQNYGLAYDQNRFIVQIDGFASNLLPDIRILTIGGEGDE
ncbi:MAG: hypothetical protein E7319_04000 [Clostridiales bacterium]|nr:hypothetical protein [Clostridiales bacterium]